MVESRAREIPLEDVRRPIFIALLEYLYTDEVDVALDIAMELFQVGSTSSQLHKSSLRVLALRNLVGYLFCALQNSSSCIQPTLDCDIAIS